MNDDNYVEWLVKRKDPAYAVPVKILMIVVCIFSVLSALQTVFGVIVMTIAGVATYFVFLNLSVEFEYLYVDKEISVDKILNKTKRKKVEKFETESMEIFAPINSWHLDNMKNRQLKVTDYSSGVAGQPDRRYVMIYSGDRKIIFEPSEAMVKALQSVAPRKVFFD